MKITTIRLTLAQSRELGEFMEAVAVGHPAHLKPDTKRIWKRVVRLKFRVRFEAKKRKARK